MAFVKGGTVTDNCDKNHTWFACAQYTGLRLFSVVTIAMRLTARVMAKQYLGEAAALPTTGHVISTGRLATRRDIPPSTAGIRRENVREP